MTVFTNFNTPRFNMNSFRTELLKNGAVSSNHFFVRISAPRVFGNPVSVAGGFGDLFRDRAPLVSVTREQQDKFTTEDQKVMTLRCESATLPDINLTTVEGHRYGYGSIDMVPYAAQYSDLNLEFVLDAKGRVYELLYEWMAAITGFNYDTSQGVGEGARTGSAINVDRKVEGNVYEVGYKDDIIANVEIYVFDRNKRPIFIVRAYNAFPRLIFASPLDWKAQDDLVRLTVPFLFKDFEIDFVRDRSLFGLYDRLRDLDVSQVLDGIRNIDFGDIFGLKSI